MKVFISWSGDLSRQLAEVLREWLPSVLQTIEPWMSAEDIDKGARSNTHIARELEATKAGILCLTPDNLEAPWLIFEAGALSKTLDRTFVSPFLLGLRPAELKGPLVQFQATEANREDTRRLVATLNTASGEASLPERVLDKTFGKWWPELEVSLKALQSREDPKDSQPLRSEREILEELLALARDQEKRQRVAEDEEEEGGLDLWSLTLLSLWNSEKLSLEEIRNLPADTQRRVFRSLEKAAKFRARSLARLELEPKPPKSPGPPQEV